MVKQAAKRVSAVMLCIVMVLSMFALNGCSANGAADGSSGITADEAITKLNAADKIVLKKDYISFGDHWSVYVDNEKVADIEGEFIKIWDCYVMRSTNGEFICAEQEQFKLITATAAKVDESGNEIGRYNQKISFLLLQMESLDPNGEVIAKLEQNLGLSLNCTIKTNEGQNAWHAKKDLINIGARIVMTKEANHADVPVTDAIMMVAVANELDESNNSD